MTTTREKKPPMISIHTGVVGGQTKASRIPVTTADRSPMELVFFMTLRYSHSQTTQAATDTRVTVSARQPNT